MSKRAETVVRLSLVALLSNALMGLIVPLAASQSLTVDQIIEKNIAARGGLKAWRDVQSMTFTGKMDAGTKKNIQLPFVMMLKRPQMSRIELDVAGKKALQIYDGTNGWKVRPYLGRNEVEPYTTKEMQEATLQAPIDGYLIDHEAKGIKVEVMGQDSVEGHDAYRLRLTLKDGRQRNLWVDAQSFLEVKIEDPQRRMDGKMRNVETYYRNYTSIGGLMIPFVFETAVENFTPSHKITIEKVDLNPKIDDSAFARPNLPVMNAATPIQQGASQAQPPNPSAKDSSAERIR